VLLLIGGILVLSLHPQYPGIWWLPLTLDRYTFHVPLPGHFLVCGIAANSLTTALFVGSTTFRVEAGILLGRSPSDGRAWPLWLVLYAATIGLLASLLNHRLGAGVAPLAYSLAAAVLTFAAAATWCLALMPARFWLNWLGRDPHILPVTIVAAGLTYLGGHHLTGLLVTSFEKLTGPLQGITLRLVAILLGSFTRNVVFDPQNSIIGTRHFSVFVDVPCAGWEGIGLFCTFFTIYLWLYRRELRFPQVLVLLPIGALIVWLSNALRLILLILLGGWWASAAIEGFHSVAGWLFFDAVTVTLVVVSRQLSVFAKASPGGYIREAATPNSAAPYLVPLVLIIATAMITRVFSSGFDLLYPLRFALGGAALWFYRNRISLRWKVSWSTVGLGFLGFAVWLALPQGDWNVSTEGAFSMGLSKLPSWGQFLWLFFRALAAIVVIPIAEELAFRGYLLRKLVRADFETVPFGQFT
jgi:exosortase E/protease (VPEID-CTERM system)